MKTPFIRAIVGASIGLLSFVAVPAYGGDGREGGGGHAGFIGGSARGASMARGYTEPGISRPTGTGKDTTHREPRLERRFMVQVRGHKVGPLPDSLLGRQAIPVATTSHEINPRSALPIGALSSNAPVSLQKVWRCPTRFGRDKMPPTGSDSTRKQNKGCVTGKAQRLDTPMQNVITRNTGVILITTTMIGGVIIARLLFLLGEVFGVGMTAGGIRPGATTRITPTTITTARSTATMDFDPTR
jgi:hypothetical protein